MTFVISFAAAVILSVILVVVLRWQKDEVSQLVEGHNDWIKIQPTWFSYALVGLGVPMMFFLSLVLFVLVFTTALSEFWLSALFCLLAIWFLYTSILCFQTIFLIRVEFSNDEVIWKRFSGIKTLKWSEISEISETRLHGFRLITNQRPLALWPWSLGIRNFLDMARDKGVPIKTTVPISVIRGIH